MVKIYRNYPYWDVSKSDFPKEVMHQPVHGPQTQNKIQLKESETP